MKNTLAKVLTIAPVVLIIVGIVIASLSFVFNSAEAKYQPSPATVEMSKDIKTAQEFVKEMEIKVLEAKAKATVYRKAICATEKDACTAEYLDPLGSGVDLSVFTNPQAHS